MRIALTSSLLFLGCLGLAGCGQKGPLFLPTEPPPARAEPAEATAPAASSQPSTPSQPSR